MAVGGGDDVGVAEGVEATVGVDAGDGVGVDGTGVAVSVDVGRGDAERAMLLARAYVADGAVGCLFSRDRSNLDEIVQPMIASNARLKLMTRNRGRRRRMP